MLPSMDRTSAAAHMKLGWNTVTCETKAVEHQRGNISTFHLTEERPTAAGN